MPKFCGINNNLMAAFSQTLMVTVCHHHDNLFRIRDGHLFCCCCSSLLWPTGLTQHWKKHYLILVTFIESKVKVIKILKKYNFVFVHVEVECCVTKISYITNSVNVTSLRHLKITTCKFFIVALHNFTEQWTRMSCIFFTTSMCSSVH